MQCTVKKIPDLYSGNTFWDREEWGNIPVETLCHSMGNRPQHFPNTLVKLGYDNNSIALIFQVADRYIRATAAGHQQSVCQDSCVEFFFSPGPESDRGYFNFEINCGGTFLFHFHPRSTRETFVELPETLCSRITSHHSLPRIVDPEIGQSHTWTVAFRIPLDILEEYYRIIAPAPGTVWRCNFYKCADASSHPHWLTWAPVSAPKPDFHLPRFFGRLVFE